MTPVDVALFISVIGSIVLFGGAAVLALSWAFRTGQLENFHRGVEVAQNLRKGLEYQWMIIDDEDFHWALPPLTCPV